MINGPIWSRIDRRDPLIMSVGWGGRRQLGQMASATPERSTSTARRLSPQSCSCGDDDTIETVLVSSVEARTEISIRLRQL